MCFRAGHTVRLSRQRETSDERFVVGYTVSNTIDSLANPVHPISSETSVLLSCYVSSFRESMT